MPTKAGFFITPDSNEAFERAMNAACSLWGGMFSPIIPLYQQLPDSLIEEYNIEVDTSQYYKGILDNYDPDVIIYDDNLDEEYVKQTAGDREMFKISEVEESIIHGLPIIGVGIDCILDNIIEDEFKYKRNDDLTIVIPTCCVDDKLLKVHLGSFHDKLIDKLKNQYLDHPCIQFEEVNYGNIREILGDNITAFELNSYKLKFKSYRWWTQFNGIMFIDPNKLSDLMLFWNLRALGCSVYPISILEMNNHYYDGYLSRIFEHYISSDKPPLFSILLGKSARNTPATSESIYAKVAEKRKGLNSQFHIGYQDWTPRYWESKKILEADKVISGTQYVKYDWGNVTEVDNDYLQFEPLKLPFNIDFNGNNQYNYKILLKFSFYPANIDYAGIISDIRLEDWKTITYIPLKYGRIRFTKKGIYYFISDDRKIGYQIPKSHTFFKVFYSNKGYKLLKTPNGKLADEVLKNWGGIIGTTRMFVQPAFLNVLKEFSEQSNIEFASLLGIIKRSNPKHNKDNDFAQAIIKNLIDNKIIKLFAAIKCPYCHQTSYYLPNELNPNLLCSECHNLYAIPAEYPINIKWTYRAIGTFAKNNMAGGILSVFACLGLINSEFGDNGMSSLIGFELQKGKATPFEVDLVTLISNDKHDDFIQPDLLFFECKTYNDFLDIDIERMKTIGDEFPNSILVFATLKNELKDDEKQRITNLLNHFRGNNPVGNRPRNSILILTGNELCTYRGLHELEEDKKRIRVIDDNIGYYSEMSVKKYLGVKIWSELVSEQWAKTMSERKAIEE